MAVPGRSVEKLVAEINDKKKTQGMVSLVGAFWFLYLLGFWRKRQLGSSPNRS